MQDFERKKTLRREMDQYIAQRRKTSVWALANEKQQSPLHPAVHTYKHQEAKPEEDRDAPEAQAEETGKGWFGKVLDKLFGDDGTDEFAEADTSSEAPAPTIDEVQEDLKTIATISLNVMKSMPGDQIKNFKNSSDYDLFKSVLKKHKLIK